MPTRLAFGIWREIRAPRPSLTVPASAGFVCGPADDCCGRRGVRSLIAKTAPPRAAAAPVGADEHRRRSQRLKVSEHVLELVKIRRRLVPTHRLEPLP